MKFQSQISTYRLTMAVFWLKVQGETWQFGCEDLSVGFFPWDIGENILSLVIGEGEPTVYDGKHTQGMRLSLLRVVGGF